ncbi:hypothetical protein [Arenibaculum sp.]|jgi:hypothetical protein|uniref:hypothetical protein n=1 Tax=Arenibaculum sp. TaxID=2865862 RepID=UPI002E156B3F|nr:hypothetical protein [Arenibaculum sp.]
MTGRTETLKWVRIVVFDGPTPATWAPFRQGASMSGLRAFVVNNCRPPTSIDGHDVACRIDYMMLPVAQALDEGGFSSVVGVVLDIAELLSETGDLRLKRKASLLDLIARVNAGSGGQPPLYRSYGFRVWAVVPEDGADRYIGVCRDLHADIVVALGVRPGEVQFQRISTEDAFFQVNQTLVEEVAIRTRFPSLDLR